MRGNATFINTVLYTLFILIRFVMDKIYDKYKIISSKRIVCNNWKRKIVSFVNFFFKFSGQRRMQQFYQDMYYFSSRKTLFSINKNAVDFSCRTLKDAVYLLDRTLFEIFVYIFIRFSKIIKKLITNDNRSVLFLLITWVTLVTRTQNTI